MVLPGWRNCHFKRLCKAKMPVCTGQTVHFAEPKRRHTTIVLGG
uniref:Uncharacterized protein n=1 Tax=Rheinheimera sp. BAL341 TaxID=1708203 RepID=A0A486XWW6_9GAMM